MTDRADTRNTFGSGRRARGILGLVVGILLSLYNLLVVNMIAFRHPERYDFTEERLNSLSERTRDRLKLVQEPIRVVIPTFLQRNNPRHRAEREVLRRALGVLHEMILEQPRIRIEAELDVMAAPDRWEEVRERFDLASTQVSRFLFFAGANNELRQSVLPADLATFGAVADPVLEEPPVLDFRGEEALTEALVRLVRREKRPVYFTQGKQELPLLSTSGRAARPDAPLEGDALNLLLREMETAGYAPKAIELGNVDEIPQECKLLIIASPFQAYKPEELLVVDRYLKRGGHLFVALGPSVTGLENLLADWGVEVKTGKIMLRKVGIEGWGETSNLSIYRYHRDHPITKVFLNSRFQMLLLNARPLSTAGLERRLESSALLETYSAAEGDTHFRVSDSGRREVLEKADFPVAVAVEQKAPGYTEASDFQESDTRIVVVGSGSFLRDSNFPLAFHRDFFMNSVSWLIGDDLIHGASGRKWTERTLDMSSGFRAYLRWIPTLLFPGLFLCVGLFVYYLRRT